RLVGLIYGSFDETRHKIPRIAIPPDWPRYLGLDFGGVNTAGVFFAEERDAYHKPTGRLFAYREYKAGERSAAEHCYHLMKGEPRIPTCAGGSKSEGQWRRGFAAGGTVNGVRVAGIPIHGPAKPEAQSVDVGINRVFGAFALNQLVVFDDLKGFLDELQSYSYELDEPTEKIEAKETFHLLDAVRYIISYLHIDKPKHGFSGSPVARKGLQNL